jgi:hypothetical protein
VGGGLTRAIALGGSNTAVYRPAVVGVSCKCHQIRGDNRRTYPPSGDGRTMSDRNYTGALNLIACNTLL